MGLIECLSRVGEFFTDIFGLLCLHEGCRIRIVVVNRATDRVDQLSNALEHTVPDSVLCQIPEPAFDDFQP